MRSEDGKNDNEIHEEVPKGFLSEGGGYNGYISSSDPEFWSLVSDWGDEIDPTGKVYVPVYITDHDLYEPSVGGWYLFMLVVLFWFGLALGIILGSWLWT